MGVILTGDMVGEQPGAIGGRHAGDIGEVFDRKRHAMQPALIIPIGQRLVGGLGQTGFLGPKADDGVECRIQPRNPVQVRAHHLDTAELAMADRIGKPRGAEQAEVNLGSQGQCRLERPWRVVKITRRNRCPK